MGLSFRYSSTIKNTNLVEPLALEIQDICIDMQWKHSMVIIDGICEGITFTPTECETIFFIFDENGRMINPIWIADIEHNEQAREYAYSNACKTQFGGASIHICIMKLLEYLNTKYELQLNIIDEGQYWETKDEQVFMKIFDRYESTLKELKDVLSGKASDNPVMLQMMEAIKNALAKGKGGRPN
jgi:hypothetical protein